jgi:hypothetical protein
MLAGAGVILMILAPAFGVLLDEQADSRVLTLVFTLGLALFICGFGGWMAVVRPFTHFDDINEPLAEAHSHGHHPEGHDALGANGEDDEHALPATTETAIEPAHH